MTVNAQTIATLLIGHDQQKVWPLVVHDVVRLKLFGNTNLRNRRFVMTAIFFPATRPA